MFAHVGDSCHVNVDTMPERKGAMGWGRAMPVVLPTIQARSLGFFGKERGHGGGGRVLTTTLPVDVVQLGTRVTTSTTTIRGVYVVVGDWQLGWVPCFPTVCLQQNQTFFNFGTTTCWESCL